MSELKRPRMSRRQTLGLLAGGTGALVAQPTFAQQAATIAIDPTPRHELSPYLYMQFMEPRGAISEWYARALAGRFGNLSPCPKACAPQPLPARAQAHQP
jgi:hypothetical protein